MLKRLFGACALMLIAGSAIAENPRVLVTTSLGEFELELNAEEAPISVENFLRYADAGHYDGTIFHRVIDGFMIQGGGYTPELGSKPTRAAIMNEAPNGLKNTRGTIAMARTNDPHSATAQFFINTVHNAYLDWFTPGPSKHPVFGKVTSGMEVVQAINETETDARDRPRTPVRMISVKMA